MAHPAEIRMKPMREPNFSRPSVVVGGVLMRALLSESKMETMAARTPPSRMFKPEHYTQQNELMQKAFVLLERPAPEGCGALLVQLVHSAWLGDKLHMSEEPLYYTTLKCSKILWKGMP